jgi:hypothetical protein
MTPMRRAAEEISMAVRLAALFPRAVVVVLVWVLGTAAFTYAADTQLSPSTRASAKPAQAPVMVVPSVTGQAYVFAKGTLEDAGFAWRVGGSVHGYAANTVIGQLPAAGTRVVDTGAPTILLRLVRGPYGENGVAEDSSSYHGTRIQLADLVSATVPAAPARPVKSAAKPKSIRVKKRVHRTHAKKAAKPAKPAPAKKSSPAQRPPAFRVARAPMEPLDEMTLSVRARRLQAWLATGPPMTDANVQHWLYQHAWIVTGARFGWWHGAQALQILIAADRHVESMWGIGHRSEAVAHAALLHVRREARRS